MNGIGNAQEALKCFLSSMNSTVVREMVSFTCKYHTV